MGVVSPAGAGVEAHHLGLVRGESFVRSLDHPDLVGSRSAIGASCRWEVGPEAGISLRHVALGVEAARQAMMSSEFSVARASNVAIVVGTAVGSTTEILEAYKGRREFESTLLSFDALERELAAMLHTTGHTCTVSTGCTAGLDALGVGLGLLDTHEAVLVVASDAPLNGLVVSAFEKIRALSTSTEDPARASRPFDAERDGFCLGEGAAAVVLVRGPTLASSVTLRAVRSVSSAYHMTAMRQDGHDLIRLMDQTLKAAGMSHQDVGLVDSHGTSTRQNDHAEAVAVQQVFAGRSLPVTAQKAVNGHALGSSNLVEFVGMVRAMQTRDLPVSSNSTSLDEEVDVVVSPRSIDVDVALKVSSGFSGIHTAAIVELR